MVHNSNGDCKIDAVEMLDARGTRFDTATAESMLNRAAGSHTDRTLPGRVEIWLPGAVKVVRWGMAAFKCRCGTELSDTVAPGDVLLWVYTDREWDQYMVGDCVDPVAIPLPRYDVWKCPVCGRIHVFDGDTRLRTYVIESE